MRTLTTVVFACLFASGASAQTATIWELDDLLHSKALPTHLSTVPEFVANGATMAVVGDRSQNPITFVIWQDDQTPIATPFTTPPYLAAIAQSGNAATFADNANIGDDAGHYSLWTAANGTEELDATTSDGMKIVHLDGITNDGARIVAKGRYPNDPLATTHAVIWEKSSGWTSLGVPGTATVSGDGSTIVYRENNEFFRSKGGSEFALITSDVNVDLLPISSISTDGKSVVWGENTSAQDHVWLWREGFGNTLLEGFGFTGQGHTSAISNDGKQIYGRTNSDFSGVGSGAAVWDREHGTRVLQDVLISEFGLGDVLAGWDLRHAEAVTSDGIIMGRAINPAGEDVEFALVFDQVPEPSSVALLLLAVINIVGARHRQATAVTTLGMALLVTSAGAAEFIPLDVGRPAGFFLMDISDDGSTVVGSAYPHSSSPDSQAAYRWMKETGKVDFEFPEPTVGTNRATGISGDGMVADVLGDNNHVYRWTEASGYTAIGGLSLDRVEAYDLGISRDGSAIVGTSYSRSTHVSLFDAFRWTEANGMINLGSLDPESGSEATAVSGNGSVVVGHSTSQAFRWTESSGMVGLGSGDFPVSQAYAVSDDGSIVLGGLQNNHPGDPSTPNDPRPALWTEAGGWIVIDDNIMAGRRPASMSSDGSLVAFSQIIPQSNGTEQAIFVWTENEGKRLLADILNTDLGLGAATAAWKLATASVVSAISHDGRFLAGVAEQSNGDFGAFLVDFRIPEPSSASLLVLAVLYLGNAKRRERH